jgi:hypothetical protein
MQDGGGPAAAGLEDEANSLKGQLLKSLPVKADRARQWLNEVSTGIMTAGRSEGGGDTPAVKREQIAANWASRGFSCELWTYPPGQR